MSHFSALDYLNATLEVDGEEKSIKSVELGKLSEEGSTVKFYDGTEMSEEKFQEKVESGEVEVIA